MLKKFSVLRFMDGTSTNGNPSINWTDRTPPDYASWAYGPIGQTGVPWEVASQLESGWSRYVDKRSPHGL